MGGPDQLGSTKAGTHANTDSPIPCPPFVPLTHPHPSYIWVAYMQKPHYPHPRNPTLHCPTPVFTVCDAHAHVRRAFADPQAVSHLEKGLVPVRARQERMNSCHSPANLFMRVLSYAATACNHNCRGNLQKMGHKWAGVDHQNHELLRSHLISTFLGKKKISKVTSNI